MLGHASIPSPGTAAYTLHPDELLLLLEKAARGLDDLARLEEALGWRR